MRDSILMCCILAFHLANHKDNDVPLHLFIWVLEWQEIIVIFAEKLRKKTFVALDLFHFPAVWGKGLEVFLSKMLSNERFKMMKCWTMKT